MYLVSIETKEKALIAARAAEDKKAEDVKLLNVNDLTIIADYFVICSGNSEPQIKAISDNIEEELEKSGLKVQRRAGNQESRWILLDYADVIVHVFHKNKRKYYDIESLWADAEEILKGKEVK